METALGCLTTCGDTCRTHRSSGSPQRPRALVPSKRAAFVFLWELLPWFVAGRRALRGKRFSSSSSSSVFVNGACLDRAGPLIPPLSLNLQLSTLNFFSRYTQAVGILRRLSRWMGKQDHMTHIVAGNTAPGFSLKSLDNKEYSLNTLLERGPVVAAFFKISCPVCQFTFPFLERLYKRYGGDAVTFLGISQDDPRSTNKFANEYGITFPVLIDDENGYAVSNAYGLTNVPTIFLIDTGGSVAVSSMGFDKKDLEAIATRLAERKKISLGPLFRPDEVVPANKPG
jgi:peroxiredoxin